MMRMHARRCEQSRRILTVQDHRGPGGRDAGARHDHALHATLRCTQQYRSQIGRETLVSQVRSDIDQFRKGGCYHRAVRIADNNAVSPQLRLWDCPRGSPKPSLRFSARARRVAVRIGLHGRVELVVPRGVSEARARAFLASREDWVAAQLERRRAQQPPEQAFPPSILDLTATGEKWRVFHAGGIGTPRLRETAAGLLSLTGSGTPAQMERLLVSWLSDHARKRMQPQLQMLSTAYGLPFTRLAIRRQRTRWGSCSSRGTVSINLAVLFQRPEVLRYLLCHELSHSRHMNHSSAFWRCVEICEPDYRRLDAELTQGWRRVPAWLGQNHEH